MILVDTGPLVALFDPRDQDHKSCRKTLESVREKRLFSTEPVLTEAFHILDPKSRGAENLRKFLMAGAIELYHLTHNGLRSALALMEKYMDHPMDFADASLVIAAEELDLDEIFTLDVGDFSTYRVRKKGRRTSFRILPAPHG